MPDLNRNLVFLVLQFLQELNCKEAVHKVEQETGVFFNLKYFEEILKNGHWDNVESYLSGFTTLDQNDYSKKVFFDIRKQKFYEALDKRDRAKALDILVKELKVFSTFNDGVFKQLTELLFLENFRSGIEKLHLCSQESASCFCFFPLDFRGNVLTCKEVEQISNCVDANSVRASMFDELKRVIKKDPTFRDKLQFPRMNNSVLRTLYSQSLHSPNPNCGQDGAQVPSLVTNTLAGATPETKGSSGVHGPYQPAKSALHLNIARWIANPFPTSHPTVSVGPRGLTDTNRAGVAILALASNGVHKLWKWQRNNENQALKVTLLCIRRENLPIQHGDIQGNAYIQSPTTCSNIYCLSSENNNIIAIGMEDSSIQVFNIKCDKDKINLRGHQKRITGLAFSHVLDVLVSSGADAQLFVWSVEQWMPKAPLPKAEKLVQIKSAQALVSIGGTHVHFHKDQIQLLAIREEQITIYKAPKLNFLVKWIPGESSELVTDATYSCNFQSIYASLNDGSVSVLEATTLLLMCRISPSAYLPSHPSLMVYPLVIAAHPSEPNQFALGLTDGAVYILEPLESEGKWGNSFTGAVSETNMSDHNRNLVFLVLQFLQELNCKEAVHKVEQETGVFFNLKYFEEILKNGHWDNVESYLSGFTTPNQNDYSKKVFFDIRKQKFYKALDKRDRAKALDILVKELKVFSTFNDEVFKQLTELLFLENFREAEHLTKYVDANSSRIRLFDNLKGVIEKDPTFRDKLQFPSLDNSVLRTLSSPSLHSPNPNCGQGGAQVPSPVTNTLAGATPETGGSSGVHGPYQPAKSAFYPYIASSIANLFPMSHPTVSEGPRGLTDTNRAANLDHPQTPLVNKTGMEYQRAASERVLKRSRSLRGPDEVKRKRKKESSRSSDGLPLSLLMVLNQGSAVKSMDFHPVQQYLLLVGTDTGDIMLWGAVRRERIAHRNFNVRDLGACSMALQATLASEYTASVNRVLWSPEGTLFVLPTSASSVAYSKNIVQIYFYNGVDGPQYRLEIEAHVGNVNDIAFSHPNEKLSVITCGEDKSIKVWDAVTGSRQYTFEGHQAPVSSVCPNHRECSKDLLSSQWILSASIDGKIKAWVYDKSDSMFDRDSPNHLCLKMAYSADGIRLFSCGTNKEGDLCIVEWNESKGFVKKTYKGFGKRSEGVVQFDTTNKFLAAGDEFMVKFWNLDNVYCLRSTDAEGGLPAYPCIRFNKGGTLLAVSTNDNGIKILANADGVQLLGAVITAPTTGTFGTADAIAGTSIKNGDNRSLENVIPRIADELKEKSERWKLAEIKEPSHCRCLRLPDNLSILRVSRLTYTNLGVAILALASNGVHKLWKWQRNNENQALKATSSVLPQLWEPPSEILMTNEISDINPEDAVPCFALSKNGNYLISASATASAPPQLCQPSSGLLMTNEKSDTNPEDAAPSFPLSKNDSYLFSASGGKISLFHMMTFRKMTTFMPPPPVVTFIAFHPPEQ
ncbi:hypothetical protein HHK36_021420 [Tetracentron sinense]|uniref:CTLH domain-containing protein n=1 Tax=Tetracentron sinense TaxID=13715 RepID=A0A834YPQ2_TETSI|nr:hypothetical protein HHK36_021420 [Tetracentron sinense]